jgi:hypothetical protein
MEIIKRFAQTVTHTACLALLVACGGATEEQDAQLELAPANNSHIAINGVVLNGYLANALVWIDARQNNSPDGFESFAYTDSEGYFSYNPNTGVNYCQTEEASLQRFCLQTGSQSGNVVIKAAKGIELMTGEAFRSVLSADISLDKARANSQMLVTIGARPSGDTREWQKQLDAAQVSISSLSTIAYYLNTASLNSKILEGVNLRDILNDFGFPLSFNLSNEDILNMDYIAGASLRNQDATSLFMADATLGRIADVLLTNLDEAARNVDFGINGLPLSSADSVYKALASNIESLALTRTTQATSQALVSESVSRSKAPNSNASSNIYSLILEDAISNLFETFASVNLASPATQTRVEHLAGNQQIANIAANLRVSALFLSEHLQQSTWESDLLAPFQQALLLPTLSRPVAYANETELIAIMALSHLLASGDYTYPLNILTSFAQSPSNKNVFEVHFDLQTLGDTFRELVENSPELAQEIASNSNENFSDTGSINEDISAISLLALTTSEVEAKPLANVESTDGNSPWAYKRLSMSGVQDESEQGQVVAFFTQENNSQSNSGALIMCVAYNNFDDPSDNINGKRVVGTWSALGSQSQSRMSLVAEGFTIQMSVLGETAGRDIPNEQQILSLPRNPNEVYGKYGFALNNDKANWHSDNASVNGDFGLQTYQNVPQDDQACQALLGLGS